MTKLDQTAIDFMKSKGYRVYMRNRADSYAIFEKAGRLGYVQTERAGGYRLSSVHKPNKDTGTGFAIRELPVDLTAANLEQASNMVAPHWARRPEKFAGIDEYRAHSRFHAQYAEV